jgi:hypothetical protein
VAKDVPGTHHSPLRSSERPPGIVMLVVHLPWHGLRFVAAQEARPRQLASETGRYQSLRTGPREAIAAEKLLKILPI